MYSALFETPTLISRLDETTVYANGHVNVGASLDSVVTEQPFNNNHLPPRAIMSRELNEIPLHADKLFEVQNVIAVRMRSKGPGSNS